MSYSNFLLPSQKTAYSQVGASNDDKTYVANQSDLLVRQNQTQNQNVHNELPKVSHTDFINNLRYGVQTGGGEKRHNYDKYHSYNPYYNFLTKNGLVKESTKTEITTSFINIDSSNRIIEPKMVTSSEIKLDPNPLTFDKIDISVGISSSKQNILTVQCQNHGFIKNDRIILSGIEKNVVSIKNTYTKITGSGSESASAINFTVGSTALAFKCNFDIDSDISPMSFDPNFKIGTGISHSALKEYDTSDMFVSISGFDISPSGTPYVGNIPINFLNSTHQIYFTNPDYTISNGQREYAKDELINVPTNDSKVLKITGFYIKLPIPYSGLTTIPNPMKINFEFNYIGGIPINIMNAEFPVDENHLAGYHEIYSYTTDSFSIIIPKDTYYKNSENRQVSFGGNNIYIAKINDLISGFSQQNKYRVEFPKVLHDVAMVKLISTTFPNTSKVFKNNGEIKNTKLYWQNQDDGDFIYEIEIEHGNYDPTSLTNVIQNKIYEVKRKYSKIANTSTNYTDRNFMNVTIDTNTNRVTFKGYKEAKLNKPIQTVSPEPPKSEALGEGNPPYTLTIAQSAHGLRVGDDVLFTGLISTFGIPESALNTTHTVISVPTVDTYTIKIDNVNLNPTRTDTGGGFASKAYVPSKFRLLFNYPDTMGNELGFRKVGKSIAVTKFDTVLTNHDAYQGENVITDSDGIQYILDESGNKIMLSGNSLKLSGDDYILMVVREFSNMMNLGANDTLKSCFAKINLTGLPGKLVYDTFVAAPVVFYDTLSLSELNVSFYTPNNQLFDFDGIDHSYVLEITSVDYVPDETGLMTTHTNI